MERGVVGVWSCSRKKLLVKKENEDEMKSLEVERQVLEIKINKSRVLNELKIKVFKPEKTSNQTLPIRLELK